MHDIDLIKNRYSEIFYFSSAFKNSRHSLLIIQLFKCIESSMVNMHSDVRVYKVPGRRANMRDHPGLLT